MSAAENRFTSQKSLSFRSFSRSLSRLSFRSLSFSSRTAFVVVTLIRRSHREERERDFAVKLFQIRKFIHRTLGIIRTSAEPTARHPTHRLPTFRATGAALLIRVVSSSSFSSRVKSAVDGVYLARKMCGEKSRYGKKTNTFYFIRSFLKQRPVMTTTMMRSKVFASLAKRGEKRAPRFARTWKGRTRDGERWHRREDQKLSLNARK